MACTLGVHAAAAASRVGASEGPARFCVFDSCVECSASTRAADLYCLDGYQKTEKNAVQMEVCAKSGPPNAWPKPAQIAAALHIVPPLLQQHQS